MRFPQPSQRLDAVHARHHHVEQHEIDAIGGRDVERLGHRSRQSARGYPARMSRRSNASRFIGSSSTSSSVAMVDPLPRSG